MCGRTACTLNPDQLCRACTFRDKQNSRRKPVWRHQDSVKNAADEGSPKNSEATVCRESTFAPSYNLAPDNYGPVIVSGSHFPGEFSESDRVFQPMKWGFIPSWHKGDPKDFGYKMINARLEGVTDKPAYRASLKHGRRCVVVADGFFEWKSTATGNRKTPFFVHFPQEKKNLDFSRPDSEEENSSKMANVSEDSDFTEWKGRRMLTMAGIFDVSHHESDAPLYSYAVVTVPSSKKISWMHDRMPAILDGDEAVSRWLDHENVTLKEALHNLRPVEEIDFYEVSTLVSNVRNNEPNCLMPVQQYEKAKTKANGQTSLLKFFQPKTKGVKRESSGGEGNKSKKVKKE